MSACGSGKETWVNEPNSKRQDYVRDEDRISDLPDALIINILSRLPFRCALKTCMLSKSWKRIFSSLPNLIFNERDLIFDVPDRANRLATLIDWVLANREGFVMHTLAFHFDLSGCPCLPLRSAWVNVAVENNVKVLQITAKIDEIGLPASLYTCMSLEVLKLMAPTQILNLPPAIYLPNLKDLSLVNVIFPNDNLTGNLFTGCPLLETLCITGCSMSRLTRLAISCTKLKSLRISYCSEIDKCIIDLQRASILKFYYDGFLARNVEFGNMKLQEVAALNVTRDRSGGRNDSELAPVAWSLLRASCHVRELAINVSFNKILMEVSGNLWQHSGFKNLTAVCLSLSSLRENKEVVMALLSKFPSVRKLKMIIDQPSNIAMHPEDYPLNAMVRHLEELDMENFEGNALEVGLLEFFLQNAKSLTRVTLTIPPEVVVFTPDGQSRLLCWLDDELRQMISDKVRRLTNAYTTVLVTIHEVSIWDID